jgi:EF-1 guanine nucleotide exchange domain
MLLLHGTCISYVSDLGTITSERTQALQQYKFFTCSCARCTSSTEQGRSKFIVQWKTNLQRLKQVEEGQSKDAIIQIYRDLVTASELIFPSYHVAKGRILEDYAAVSIQDPRFDQDTLAALTAARIQYSTCRGSDDDLVQRIDRSIEKLYQRQESCVTMDEATRIDNNNSSQDLIRRIDCDVHYDDHDDKGYDISLSTYRSSRPIVIFDIKTHEPDIEMQELWKRICTNFNHVDYPQVTWSPTYRLFPVGYGIVSLIMSCILFVEQERSEGGENNIVVTEYTTLDPHDLAEQICDTFDDIIQHVDTISVSNDHQ